MKKLITYLLFITLILGFGFINVKAKELNFNTNKNSVKENEKLSVIIDLDNYEKENIKIKYDENVFKILNEKSISNQDVSYEEDTNTFTLNNENIDNIKIELQTKNSLKVGTTTIKVNDEVKKIKLNGKEDQENLNFWANIKENYAFVYIILIIIAIILVIAIITIFHKNKNNLEKKEITTIIILAIIGVISLGLAIIILKADVDILNLNEKKINEYVIKLKEKVTPEENESYSTLDNNKVTTKELTINNNQYFSNSNIVYNINLNNVKIDKTIVRKNDELILSFTANVVPFEEIAAVVINNIEYTVKKVNDTYQVVINVANDFGKQDFTITNVILKNGVSIEINKQSFNVYVLKDAPVVENVIINNRLEVPELSFDVQDPDQSFISGKVEIKAVNNEQIIRTMALSEEDDNIIFKTEDVKVGKNTFALNNLKEHMKYDLKIYLSYDLDNDKTTDSNKEIDIKQVEQEEVFEREYGFELKNVDLTSKIKEGETLELQFENSAYSYADIEQIIIDGDLYDVTKNGDIYTIDNIENKCQNKGKCHITLEKVIFKDKVATKDIKENLNYIYLKEIPKINSLNVNYENGKLTGEVSVNDVDKAIVEANLIIKDATGKQVGNKIALKDLENFTFEEDLNLPEAGVYTVLLEFTYDLADDIKTTIIYGEDNQVSITELIKASISSIETTKEYVEKQETFDLKFKINSNTFEKVQKVTIKTDTTEEKDVVWHDEGYYTVQVKAQDNQGKQKFVLEKLKYQNQEISVGENAVEVIVLKTKPEITTINGTLTDDSLTGGILAGNFTATDRDEAIVGAKAILLNGAKEIATLEDIKESKSFTFNITQAGHYHVRIELVYDLNKGIESDPIIKTSDTTWNELIKASIKDVKANKKYAAKNEEVELTYTIESNTEETPTNIKINNKEVNINTDSKAIVSIPVDITGGENYEFTATQLTYSDQVIELAEETPKATVTVLKTAPTAANIAANIEAKKLKGSFSFTDPESTVTKAEVCLIVSEDKKECHTIDNPQNNKTIDYDIVSTLEAGNYQVSLKLVYNLGNDEELYLIKETTVNQVLEGQIKTVTTEKETFEKNTEFKLIYEIEDNTSLPVQSLKINDITYPVESYNNEENKYAVTLKEEKVGKKVYKATQIIYNETQIINTTKEKEIYILKETPYVTEYNYTDIEEPKITLNLVDNDSALTGTTNLILTKTDNQTTYTKELTKGENIIKLREISPDIINGDYKIEVKGTYDLDEDFTTSTTNLEEILADSQNIIMTYNPKINNLNLESINTSHLNISFESTNDANMDLTEVKIDNLWYHVTKQEDNKYEVHNIKNNGIREELKISEVKFINNKERSVENSDSILINKTKPTAEVTATVTDEKYVKVNFTVTDNDKAITNDEIYAVLKKDDETIIETQSLGTATEYTFENQLSPDIYHVEIIANYDLVDGNQQQKQLIGKSHDFVKEVEISLISVNVGDHDRFPWKNKNISITYNLKSNIPLKDSELYITAKGEEYTGEDYTPNNISLDEQKYKAICKEAISLDQEHEYSNECSINFNAPNQDGIISITANKINYYDKEFTITHEGQLIDILKDSISIDKTKDNLVLSTIKQEDGNYKFSVKFTIIDPNNLLTEIDSIKATFGATATKSTISGKENQTIDFIITEEQASKNLRLRISANFDLDHNDIVDKKYYSNADGTYIDHNYTNNAFVNGIYRPLDYYNDSSKTNIINIPLLSVISKINSKSFLKFNF